MVARVFNSKAGPVGILALAYSPFAFAHGIELLYLPAAQLVFFAIASVFLVALRRRIAIRPWLAGLVFAVVACVLIWFVPGKWLRPLMFSAGGFVVLGFVLPAGILIMCRLLIGYFVRSSR
jgi:hypothetical protein